MGTITVPTGSTLTIDPGVTAKFASGTQLLVNAKLIAIGTAGNPITFTSNAATPTPGSWRSIYFASTADVVNSRLSYANISYGGASDPGSVTMNGPYYGAWITIDHLTVSNSSSSGIYIGNANYITVDSSTISNCSGAGVTTTTGGQVTNSTITGNGSYGVNYTGYAFGALSNNTISNNGNYAVGADSTTRIDSLASLTLTGNGGGAKDAVGLRPGNTPAIGAWHSGAPWDVLGTITVPFGAALTIDPGVTAKFGADKFLQIYGNLTAIGTASQPILFTSSLETPSPGSWAGIYFHPGSGSSSQIKYSQVLYAGDTQFTDYDGAIVLNAASPTLDHVTVTQSSTKGIKITYSGTPVPLIQHCAFSNNVGGAITNGNAATITAKLNYWNSTDGPSGAGTGTGQSISSGVAYDPWITTAPSNPHFFSTVTLLNQAFNPAAGVNLTIQFETTLSGSWTVLFKNSIGTTLRTFNGNGQTANVVWDGKDSGGILMLDGNYKYEMESIGPASEVASPVHGRVVIDSTKQLVTQNFAVTPFFSPNADTIQDTATVSASFTFDDANWTLNFKNPSNTVVKTATGQGSNVNYLWDGKDSGGTLQPDEVYTVELLVSDGTLSNSASLSTTIDTIFPISDILSPTGGGLLSNVYQSGSTTVAITANISDLNLQNWSLDFGAGASPTSWTPQASGTTAVSSTSIYSWATSGLTNGTFTLRLQTWDRAGNRTEERVTLTVGNFKATLPIQQINVAASEGTTIISTIPFPLTETIVIKNTAGQVVKTLASEVPLNAGDHQVFWDGRNEAGAILPAGGYFYVATVTDGTNTLTWDLTGQWPTWYEHTRPMYPPWDPFKNNALVFSTTTVIPTRVRLVVSPVWIPLPNAPGPNGGLGDIAAGCDPPNYCIAYLEYREAGTLNYRWAGVDGTGAFRPDMAGYAFTVYAIDYNAIVVYGTKPKLTTPVSVSPSFYAPHKGTQNVFFVFTSFQNQPVNITVKFTNQASLSTLRTINMNSVSPGTMNISWDGKADNGMWVSPDKYTVTVTITDSMGNITVDQILTTVRY